jgi:hypothetical protein
METTLGIVSGIATILSIVLAVLVPLLKSLKAGKKEAVDIALAIAEGVDDAKRLLPPHEAKVMTGVLKNAAEKKNVHDTVVKFLGEHKLNQ